MVSPIIQSNVVDTIFDEIMKNIVSGEWKIGMKIPSENELATEMKVSRNSIRQALNRFIALGIIEARHGDGSYVKSVDLTFYLEYIFPMIILSKYDALNVYQLQKAIQCEAASSCVCDLCTDEQLRELTELVEEMKQFDREDDEDRFLEADMRFHVVFVEITRNPVLISIEQCVSQIMRGPLRDIVYPSVRGDSILMHDMIVRGLRDKEPHNVYHWMCAHMCDVVTRLNIRTLNET
jgi:GntR family transcriptional repressor for pyruvate dehydrogenase complex